MKYERGEKINEGKTKTIFGVNGHPQLVIVQNKDDITAFDDPTFTQKFGTKSEYATTTTCRVFELLRWAGIPVAYKEQLSRNEFVAERCEMIPLEVVIRHLAVGSYLGRHPELTPSPGDTPFRFHRLEVEFFLKTSGGKLVDKNGKVLIESLEQRVNGESKTLDDPFIPDPNEFVLNLFHPKKPGWDAEADLKKSVPGEAILGSDKLTVMDKIARQVFFVLEGAWNILGLRLIDMKIEFGLTTKGELCVADVIDNDSWRLRTSHWEELSKQAFRDGEDLSEVEKKYGTVARLSENFRLPCQVLVLWRGSDKDDFPIFDPELNDLIWSIEEVTLSGHKSPNACIAQLENILAAYPEGGVIIAKVGRSNGLGPLLAARTTLPVISIPATADKYPEDVWSSFRMPSQVPSAVVWPDSNAIELAVRILAQKNPALYMWSQLRLEELDK